MISSSTPADSVALFPPRPAHAGTVGGLIATNAAGSHRYLFGTPRDRLTGITAVRADGTIVASSDPAASGGRDLVTLLAGSFGSLGLITEAAGHGCTGWRAAPPRRPAAPPPRRPSTRLTAAASTALITSGSRRTSRSGCCWPSARGSGPRSPILRRTPGRWCAFRFRRCGWPGR